MSDAIGGLAGSQRMLCHIYNCEWRAGIMAVVLKVYTGSRIKNPTPWIDVYFLEEQPRQILYRSDLKRQIFRLFWTASPQQEEEQDEQLYGISSWYKKCNFCDFC